MEKISKEKATGIVTAVRKDRKGVQLDNGKWYSSKYFKGEVECEKGDRAEVEFTLSEDGQYNDLLALKVLERKPMQKEIREDVNASQLTSYAKDLVVAAIERLADPQVKVEIATMMEAAAKAVARAYKTIKAELAQQQAPVQAAGPSRREEEDPTYY